jgi:hypothetical protein
MGVLNWVLATEETYTKAQVTPSPTARRVLLDTPQGKQEFILEHLDKNFDRFEEMVQLMPKDSFLSTATLEMILPIESEVGDGATGV